MFQVYASGGIGGPGASGELWVRAGEEGEVQGWGKGSGTWVDLGLDPGDGHRGRESPGARQGTGYLGHVAVPRRHIST